MINDESAKYLKENSTKPGRFYIIPKIHKQGHPGSSLVSRQQQSPERYSQFADHHLQPLVTQPPSDIKDTTRFLDELNNISKTCQWCSTCNTWCKITLYEQTLQGRNFNHDHRSLQQF